MKLACLVLLSLSLAALGCTGEVDDVSRKMAEPVPHEVARKEVDVKARLMSWDETAGLIAVHKGKVVVVDIWSLGCPPCLKEFPQLVKLHNEGRKDLVCMSFNVDEGAATSKELQDEILDFLKKQNATFENIINRESSDAFYDATKTFSIPMVFVYGRDGNLAKVFRDNSKEYGKEGYSYEKHITPLVEQLLAEPGTKN